MGIDGVKNGKEPNQLIACPIASVTPDLADDLEAVISWSVDEEAWGCNDLSGDRSGGQSDGGGKYISGRRTEKQDGDDSCEGAGEAGI